MDLCSRFKSLCGHLGSFFCPLAFKQEILIVTLYRSYVLAQ